MRTLAVILFLIVNAMVFGALHELRLPGGSLTLIPITAVLSFIAVLIHELGHAVAVRRAGGEVLTIMVMPFELRMKPRRFGLSRGSGRDIGGYVGYHMPAGETRREAAAIAFAGPAANFLLTAVLLLFTLWLAGSGLAGFEFGGSPTPPLPHDGRLPSDAAVIAEINSQPYRIGARAITLVCHALAILSAGMGLANLIPFAGSDGQAIVRAMRRKRRA